MDTEFRLPNLGENIQSGDVVSLLVREGDVIAANDGVVELETDKAVLEITCPYAGKISKILVAKGEAVTVGQPVLRIEAGASPMPEAPVETAPAMAPTATTAAVGPATFPVAAGPEARRLAREFGVELAQVFGTGKGGRVTVEDVRAAQEKTLVGAPSGVPAGPAACEPVVPGELGEDAYGPVRRERMSRARKTIAAQMVKSATAIPHVTNFDDADVTDLERLRKNVPPSHLGPAVKLTMMSFAMKAVAMSLRQHPILNASIDEESEEIVYKQYVNIGVAVDAPRGLVVPVLHNVDRMGILHIARELTLLAARMRSGDFAVEELRGGTFTVSNLGAVGGTYSTPIINHPEAAILLLGRCRPLLGIHDGKIEKRLMLPLSLSYDHRIIDGATAGRFLNAVIEYLQSPGKLLLTK